MCGYTSYQDPRLIPPDIDDEDEPTPVTRITYCIHTDACCRIRDRFKSRPYLSFDLEAWAEELDCGNCDEWEDERE